MEIISCICIVNWPTEQLEVNMFMKLTDEKKLEKTCEEISKKIFFKYIKPIRPNLKLNAIFAYGSGRFDGKNKDKQNILNEIHFIFAKGIYLDSKNRSYFSPDEIILEKTIKLSEL